MFSNMKKNNINPFTTSDKSFNQIIVPANTDVNISGVV
jgi:hypothetical protein